ncbi:MAG: DUF4012 domain-containing protein [Caldilineaceae bacterium]|nr:DUF4012 domain-containing protein [Caldilineaceae bacterium]
MNSGTELRALVRAESSTENLPAFEEPMLELTRAVTGIEREMRIFSPFFNVTAWVPGVGETIAAIPELLLAGKELVTVASDGVSLIGPAMAAQTDASPADLIATTLGNAEPRVAVWSQRLDVAQQALDKIPADELHPALADRVSDLQAVLPLASFGLEIAPELPVMLGADEPRRYLLLVQNNHELRATGGFLTGIGLVTIADGKLEGVDFLDSYDVTRRDVDHPWAPEPMQSYMGIDLMFLRDANWSPDFPTTAQISKAMYAQDAGIAVDGVLSIDLRAVELLVDALSPLDVKGADVPITGDNLIEQIKEFWHRPIDTDVTIESSGGDWWEQRKDFMPALAEAALARLKMVDTTICRWVRRSNRRWTNVQSRSGSMSRSCPWPWPRLAGMAA